MQRLHQRHFRGRNERCAGNFRSFDGPEDLFQNRSLLLDIREELQINVQELSERGRETDQSSLNIEMEDVVGWDCTDAADKYGYDALEPFKPSPVSRGLRVKPNRTDLLAPPTRGSPWYKLKQHQPKLWLAFLTIRPGETSVSSAVT
jgi:hypothetical protein